VEHFGSRQLHDGVADALAGLKAVAERLDQETNRAQAKTSLNGELRYPADELGAQVCEYV